MNGELVGHWSRGRTSTETFRYSPQWPRSPNARPLSLSLPIPLRDTPHSGPVVANYFDNLLPERREVRERVQRLYRTRSTQAHDLLEAIGRDCIGAVQLLPEGDTPVGYDRIDGKKMSEADIEELLRATVTKQPGGATQEDFRISIAGMQEKTALLRKGKTWYRPTGATPTTHILKLPLGQLPNQLDLRTSVENEWLCQRLLDGFGLPTARTEIATFGAQKALVVERFDRRVLPGGAHGSWIARLPQEDFCQATGMPAHRKYEVDGGPGVVQCLDILAAGANADGDRLVFALAQLAFWLLAATDGHAKNFSIHLHRDNRFTLTPLYDVLSAWPVIGKGAGKLPLQKAALAMAVRSRNAHYRLIEIQTRHWRGLADRSGAAGAFDAMVGLVDAAEDVIARIARSLPPDFPADIGESIFRGITTQVARFRRGL
ncbi:MAG TPA: type II toxin-antitoxin system HipA family toxin [Lautropia sp.]|nr:type II toxin-antitoxin system HipA family toxin [Lautropia sp.]